MVLKIQTRDERVIECLNNRRPVSLPLPSCVELSQASIQCMRCTLNRPRNRGMSFDTPLTTTIDASKSFNAAQERSILLSDVHDAEEGAL